MRGYGSFYEAVDGVHEVGAEEYVEDVDDADVEEGEHLGVGFELVEYFDGLDAW